MTGVRIAISGIGVVSPFGVGRERYWDRVRAGCSATRTFVPEPGFDVLDLPCRVAAPVLDMGIADLPRVDGDAGLRVGEPNAGVIIGSGGGGIDVGERQYYDFFVERGRKVTPYAIPTASVEIGRGES